MEAQRSAQESKPEADHTIDFTDAISLPDVILFCSLPALWAFQICDLDPSIIESDHPASTTDISLLNSAYRNFPQ
jgi:hypothetical protein